MTYLLDTNTCIQVLRQRHSQLVQRLGSHSPSRLKLCSIVLAELLYGSQRSAQAESNSSKILAFIQPYMVLPFDDDAAVIHARIRRQLELMGTPIGPYDSQIAAIALAHGLTVVTHNTAEFARVPGLRIEDWETP